MASSEFSMMAAACRSLISARLRSVTSRVISRIEVVLPSTSRTVAQRVSTTTCSPSLRVWSSSPSQ
jgi:hypothetical protein